MAKRIRLHSNGGSQVRNRAPNSRRCRGPRRRRVSHRPLLRCRLLALRRIMRYLTHRGFFKLHQSTNQYSNTPLSLLLSTNEASLASFVLMQSSPVTLAPWHGLSARASHDGGSAFEAAHGEDFWNLVARSPAHSKPFNDAMASHARWAVSRIVERQGEVFDGIDCLVDVGGGDGTALRCIVEACPWIRGINFDLPYVVSAARPGQGVEHVAGDMFNLDMSPGQMHLSSWYI